MATSGISPGGPRPHPGGTPGSLDVSKTPLEKVRLQSFGVWKVSRPGEFHFSGRFCLYRGGNEHFPGRYWLYCGRYRQFPGRYCLYRWQDEHFPGRYWLYCGRYRHFPGRYCLYRGEEFGSGAGSCYCPGVGCSGGDEGQYLALPQAVFFNVGGHEC